MTFMRWADRMLWILFSIIWFWQIECSSAQEPQPVQLDPCGICGRDNSSCRIIAGIFTRPQLDVGYNLVAHIPRGACYLNISEVKRSSNHLALRRKDSIFILNGNWRLSQSGSYPGAGTIFQYRRQDLTALESIASPGPLKETVDLLVLHQQQRNPGIKYEYKLPPSSSSFSVTSPLVKARPADSQIALKSRSSKSQPKNDSFVLTLGNNSNKKANHRHLHFSKPVLSSHKNGIYYWKIVGYTNCSERCGGGVQRSIIHCVHTGNVLVSEIHCTKDEKPAEQRLRCNLKPCPSEIMKCFSRWIVGNWSKCKGKCGEGVMTRQVFCQQRVSPMLKMRVKEGACLNEKPEVEMKCELEKCNNWVTSDWGPCSEGCGNGVRRRIVECKDGVGGCNESMKPADLKSCNMGPCMDAPALWMASEWESTCGKCGKGLETRHVVCTTAGITNEAGYYGYGYENERSDMELITNGTEGEIVEDKFGRRDELIFNSAKYCDEQKRLENERDCFSDKLCEPEWFTGDWGECSSSCGTGLRTRQVLCVHLLRGRFKVHPDQYCSAHDKPKNKKICINTKECPARWFFSDWDECSALCGGGIHKRIVSCRNTNSTKSSHSCRDKDKPAEQRKCNEQPCASNPNVNSSLAKEAEDVEKNLKIDSSFAAFPELFAKGEKDIGVNPYCIDEYSNCALVLRARLCRYKFYHAACCHSCSTFSSS